jgi:uncharacterized membrane protein
MTTPLPSGLSPGRTLVAYAVALLIFLAIDMVWLGAVAKDFYRERIGHLIGPGVNWGAALLFYLVFVAGVVVFVVRPALEAGNPLRALTRGALFGFVAYATYDLTNQATMRDWPMLVTVVDLAWGTVLTAVVAYLTWQVSTRILSVS